ncbi:MAG: hypothetical protein WA634_19595 [Silvibacterium sp.]
MNILRAIFYFVYEIFLGCSHKHLTRPFTLQQETYMVCLDCGKQIFYSPVTMRTLTGREVRHMHAAHAGEVRVMPVNTGRPKLVPARVRKPDAA